MKILNFFIKILLFSIKISDFLFEILVIFCVIFLIIHKISYNKVKVSTGVA